MSHSPMFEHGLIFGLRRFFQLLWKKADEDDALFLAAGIAWGVLFALVPLLALGIGVTGYVLSARFADPAQAVVTLFARVLPEGDAGVQLSELLSGLVGEVMVNRTGLTVVGSLIFVWLASRLSGSLRGALYKVFDVGTKRSLLVGKLFDLGAVIVGVVLVTLNMGVTAVFTGMMEFGIRVFGWGGTTLSFAQRFLGLAIAFLSIWTLFLIVYRYLPLRKTPWGTTLVAATFSAVAHEALKFGFSWYATEMANYTSTLGNLATIAVLLLWIYYGALVFILGGEVAYVYALMASGRSETV